MKTGVSIGAGAERASSGALLALLLGCAALVSPQDARAQGAAVVPGVTLHVLDGSNRVIDPEHDALGVSHVVTNDGSLPEGYLSSLQSGEPNDVRLEINDAAVSGNEIFADLESLAPAMLSEPHQQRSALRLSLRRSGTGPFRSAFVRLVGDDTDLRAPGSSDRTLLVSLRDVVRARYETPRGTTELELRVARPGAEPGPASARRARLVVHVLRIEPQGQLVIGQDDASALAIMRAEIRVGNEVWLQCGLTFGEPSETAIELVAPPPSTLLSVADGDGLPAAGGGELTFVVDGHAITKIFTRSGQTPRQTADAIERALRSAGFAAQVSENPATRYGAGGSADVLVRRMDGGFVHITSLESGALSTDARQTLSIGSVDLFDGLEEFDNMTAQAGTLEERTLIKALADDDPSTIDLFIVNRFTQASRQGEAFIATGDGAIINTVVLDRQGLRHLPLAWTLAHEVGHVLLDDPLHPDNVGPDRPWLLMDADNSRGTVNGPKRLRPEECVRMREVAAHAKTPLLTPYDIALPAAISGSASIAATDQNAKQLGQPTGKPAGGPTDKPPLRTAAKVPDRGPRPARAR